MSAFSSRLIQQIEKVEKVRKVKKIAIKEFNYLYVSIWLLNLIFILV